MRSTEVPCGGLDSDLGVERLAAAPLASHRGSGSQIDVKSPALVKLAEVGQGSLGNGNAVDNLGPSTERIVEPVVSQEVRTQINATGKDAYRLRRTAEVNIENLNRNLGRSANRRKRSTAPRRSAAG